MLASGGCDPGDDTSSGPITERAADEGEGEGESQDEQWLDKAPYRVELDAEAGQHSYEATLDLGAFDPEKEVTIFMQASQEPGTMHLFDPGSGEVFAEAEEHGVYESQDGPIYVSSVRLNPSLADAVAMAAEFSPGSSYMWMLLCDEIVENRNDTGAGSLRRAIADVRNDGSVCFDPVEFSSAAGGPVQLSGEILVGKSVHIHGTGWWASRVEAGGQDRIFNFSIATDSTIHKLGVSDGAADEGGLIKSRGDLRLEDCELHSGEASRGGAVYTAGELFLEGTSVIANEAELGGGIYNDDALVTMLDSKLRANEAVEGGGIYGTRASLRFREESLIMHNHATRGGGLYIDDPGGISGYNGIWGGSITANTASEGGGVYVGGGRLEIDFDSRQPWDPTAIWANLAERGGGVYVAVGGFLDVKFTNVIGLNGAQLDGGGIYNRGQVQLLNAAAVSDNRADRHGGGVYNDGDLELRNSSRIVDNSVVHSGGGVYNTANGLLKIWDSPCRIEDNRAVTGGGSGSGGGVFNAGGTLDYLSHEIVSNTPNNVFEL